MICILQTNFEILSDKSKTRYKNDYEWPSQWWRQFLQLPFKLKDVEFSMRLEAMNVNRWVYKNVSFDAISSKMCVNI